MTAKSLDCRNATALSQPFAPVLSGRLEWVIRMISLLALRPGRLRSRFSLLGGPNQRVPAGGFHSATFREIFSGTRSGEHFQMLFAAQEPLDLAYTLKLNTLPKDIQEMFDF